MYLCYIDESGTSDISGNTSHFILAGLSIPIWHWNVCERDITIIKHKYNLDNAEIHTAWIARKYLEQNRIAGFQSLNRSQRKSKVGEYRKSKLLEIQKSGNNKSYHQTKKNYEKTKDYIHLTFEERKQFLNEIGTCVSKWGFARLFAECIDKIYFDPEKHSQTVDEQAFEQVISRFEKYLKSIRGEKVESRKIFGLLIHDNNPTVNKKHTLLMRKFHKEGTLWTEIKHIIETPLFVDSELTSMIQIADLCSFAIRRYLENNEDELFDLIFMRADRKYDSSVGVRHFTQRSCSCKICAEHSQTSGFQKTIDI